MSETNGPNVGRGVGRRIGRRSVDEALAVTADVDGWMTADQGRRLYAAATRVPVGGRIVEIGSFRGRSTIVLALAAPEAEIVAIDPHAGNDRGPQEIHGYEDAADEDFEVFHRNLAAAGVDERVRHIRRFSAEALGEVDGAVDVLYVDGAHRFGPARDDLVRWGRRVVPGGRLLVHDSFSSIGVTLALLVTLVFGGEFRYVGRSQTMTEYRREPMDVPTRLRSSARQLAQLPYFARNVLFKVLITLRLTPVVRALGGTGEWPY